MIPSLKGYRDVENSPKDYSDIGPLLKGLRDMGLWPKVQALSRGMQSENPLSADASYGEGLN